MIDNFKSGVSRRSFMRTIGAASVAATSLPAFAALQQAPAGRNASFAQGFGGPPDPDMVRISSNENPLGPSAGALTAIAGVGVAGGRYGGEFQTETIRALSVQFGLKMPEGAGMRGGGRRQAAVGHAVAATDVNRMERQEGYVTFWPGSGGALDLAFYSNLGPDKPLVMADPSYEQGAQAAAKMKAGLFRVPLTSTGAHDVKAMVAASPNAGAYYIVNPNNPTGTMTPKADIVWLVENKRPGSVVIIDEAYHHFSPDESSIDLVAADKDVIVLRTFSKVYGMAGLRAGFFIAKPELQSRVRTIGPAAGTGSGSSNVAVTTAAAAAASMNDPNLVPARRKINKDIRENVLEWMDKNNFGYMKGSQANFFQADVKRPGREFSNLMRAEKVQIGRTWPAMPNYVRVTIGTQAEMDKFKVAYKKCMETPPLPASAYLDVPFEENPSELNRHLV